MLQMALLNFYSAKKVNKYLVFTSKWGDMNFLYSYTDIQNNKK